MDRYTRDGLTFEVRDEGPRDGSAVVLLHGFPQDARAWDRVVPHLHAEGVRTLAPDQRGYSPDARPSGIRAYRMSELVADVVALLDAAGLEEAHIVGHDWGASVAWEVAGRHPDRVRTLTALSVPHPAAVAWALLRSRQWLRSWYVAAIQVPFVPERLMAGRLGDGLAGAGLNAEDAQHYGERFATPDSLTGPMNWYRAFRFAAGDRTVAARRIAVPTTFVWGRRDAYIVRATAERCEQYVDADYRFVPLDANHWLPENAPDAVAEHILDRVAPG